jgi:hypothetical protein
MRATFPAHRILFGFIILITSGDSAAALYRYTKVALCMLITLVKYMLLPGDFMDIRNLE